MQRTNQERGYVSKQAAEAIGCRNSWQNYRVFLAEMVRDYNSELPFSNVLDIGTGFGQFIECCSKYNIEAMGIEGENYHYNECIKKGYKVYQINLELRDKLPFGDNTFSGILCNQLIEHLSSSSGIFLLEECYRLLKPGGVLVLRSPGHYSRLCRTMPAHVHCWKAKEIQDVLNNIGFCKIVDKNTGLEFTELFKYKENGYAFKTLLKQNKRGKPTHINLIFSLFCMAMYKLTRRQIFTDSAAFNCIK